MGNEESSMMGAPSNFPSETTTSATQSSSRSSQTETFIRKLHKDCLTAFDPDNDTSHMLILRSMWSCFNDGTEFKRSGKEWVSVGFQSADPVTDFRATGFMGAKVLRRILDRNKRLVGFFLNDIKALQTYIGNEPFYPLMANCISILVGVCKIMGLGESHTSANVFKVRPVEKVLVGILPSSNNAASFSSTSASTHQHATHTPTQPPNKVETFFKDIEKAFNNLAKSQDDIMREKMQLDSLFQDIRTFELLILHVMIQFHNDFMHDAIHKGATYMDASTILKSTLDGTTAWLCEKMPLFERLKILQSNQSHYNAKDYVSVYSRILKSHYSQPNDNAAKKLEIDSQEDTAALSET